MKKKRRAAPLPRDRGLTLMEVVLVFSVVAVLAAILAPMGKGMLDLYKAEGVRKDLRKIAAALESYWLDNHTGTWDATYGFFPVSTLRPASGFLNLHIYSDPEDDVLSDKFGVNQDYVYSVSGTPPVATVYSRGPNRNDDGGGRDDIKIEVNSERIGRIITMAKLHHIGRAAAEWIHGNQYAAAGDAWDLADINGTTRTTLGLNAYYGVDGWGSDFQIHTTRFRIYSLGPDRTDNTDTDGAPVDSTAALAGDDIGW